MATAKSSNGHTSAVYEDTESSLPPNNPDAEAALIGSILIDPDRFDEINMEPAMFFSSLYRETFKVFGELKKEKRAVDIVTVLDLLRGKGIEQEAEIVGLLTIVPTSTNILSYADIVKKLYVRRRLISVAGKIATGAFHEETDLNEIISGAHDDIRTVGADATEGEPISSYDLCDKVLSSWSHKRENSDARDESTLATGFLDLDRLLQGLEPGALITNAGRPGMGKSMLEQQIRINVAKQGKRVVAFNLEMSAEQLAARAIASATRSNYKQLTSTPNMFNELGWTNVQKALGQMSQLQMWIDDTPRLTISQAESKISRLIAEHGHFDLITIDYLQLMQGRTGAKNRVEEIGQITRGLKQIAREHETVVWANAQVNRAVEARTDKRPLLSDLRESGDIEQDSDIVILQYRDEYYNPESERSNILELDVAKNRNGAIGTVDVFFNAASMRISNLTREPIDL